MVLTKDDLYRMKQEVHAMSKEEFIAEMEKAYLDTRDEPEDDECMEMNFDSECLS